MSPSLQKFTGGIGFLSLGVCGLVYRGAQLPSAAFRGHPLAAPEGGIPVEFMGWLGVGGWILCALGLFFTGRGIYVGIESGAIESWIKEKLPEKKVEEDGSDDDAQEA